MKKPRESVIMDSWHDPNSGHAYISSRVHEGDNGICLALNFQGDIETKDVWLSLKDAKRLTKAIKTQLQYIKHAQEDENLAD